jgi:hypothetical protein
VLDSLGDPWSGRPVFLEGKDMIYSGADGRFRFDNVPTGTRWILAYRSSGDDVFDSQPLTVNAGLTTDVVLTPTSSGLGVSRRLRRLSIGNDLRAGGFFIPDRSQPHGPCITMNR